MGWGDCARYSKSRLQTGGNSGAEEVSRKEEHVGGTFCEATHKVGIPLRSKRNIYAHFVAVAYQVALQIAAHSIQHLKLEMFAADPARRSVSFCRIHDGLVVCCQPVINRTIEKHVAQLEKVCVHVRLARISDIGRLIVSAFAEPDTDAFGEQLLHVGLGTVEVGLNDDADRTARSRACMDAAHDVERDF